MKINGENCKPIPGFSRYVISENARIYRVVAITKKEKEQLENDPEKKFIKESKVQKYSERKQGRWSQIGLVNDKGKLTTGAVEKLLCNSFSLWPKSNTSKSIVFKDGNSFNITINNIDFVDIKPRNSKLSKDDVKVIKSLISKKLTLTKIASQFGVSDMQISRIKSGENWRKGGRIAPVPKAPFEINDGKIRRFVSSFEFSKIDDNIRRPFTLKRTDIPTQNKIIGVLNGYRLTKNHNNVSRAKELIYKLNLHFFNEEIATKMNEKISTRKKRKTKEIIQI